ncbi:MAG: hypothetical protein JAZ19_17635 [Candidatus Thiodiazotropha taylori]|nr:hypothetical protein [Candidatus Thiodiazotropha taylori]
MEVLKELDRITEADERQQHFAVVDNQTGEYRRLTLERETERNRRKKPRKKPGQSPFRKLTTTHTFQPSFLSIGVNF